MLILFARWHSISNVAKPFAKDW